MQCWAKAQLPFGLQIQRDEEAPGGFDHSGKIIMLDKRGKIRSFCDGTDPESVTKFMGDIDLLLKEYE